MMQRLPEAFVEVPVDPAVAALPKADLHLHQEERPRLDRVLARRRERLPYDWRTWTRHLMEHVPPGVGRLEAMATPDSMLLVGELSSVEETIIAKLVDIMEEAAADGAILVEIQIGPGGRAFWRSDFMALFREAERRVQARYPRFNAEALGFLSIDAENNPIWQQQFEACREHARQGLAGINIVVHPYTTAAHPMTWERAYRWAARLADMGLGISAHTAEFSSANLQAALNVPGLRRLGHGVHATPPCWMEQIAEKHLTVECCLTCNVILGAVKSYEEHPIRQFANYGIPVTLNTDNPVRMATTIGREYAVAAALGFSADDMLGFTRNAIIASFTSRDRREAMLAQVGVQRVQP